MGRRRFAAVVIGASALGAMVTASCTGSTNIADQVFVPAVPGRLTVATSLPAPGFWEGRDVDDLIGGYEYGIADALADRFDLDLVVIDVPFERLVAGDLGGADLALAQITVTADRAREVAFSVAYYADDAGAVVAAGEELTDLRTATEQRWAVERGTVEADVLEEQIRPHEEPVLFDDVVSCVDAVADGIVDAALLDLTTALVLTNGRDDVTTGGRVILDGSIAAALPSDSANVEVVDAALRRFERDGTLDDLADTSLTPVFEREPESVPVIRTGSS